MTLEASWTVAHQAPLSIGFSGQEYWSGLPLPSPGQVDSLPAELPGKQEPLFYSQWVGSKETSPDLDLELLSEVELGKGSPVALNP